MFTIFVLAFTDLKLTYSTSIRPPLVPSPPQQYGMSQSISPTLQSYPQSAMSGGMGGPTSGLPNVGMNNNMTR